MAADPQINYKGRAGTFRLVKWGEAAPTVTGSCGTGRSNCISGVSDPRVPEWPGKHSNKYKIEQFDKPSGTVIGATDIQSGAQSIADPRISNGSQYGNNYQVDKWNEPAHTVIGSRVGSGAVLVGDPRFKTNSRPNLYGVADWNKPISTVTGSASVSSSNAVAAVQDIRYGEYQNNTAKAEIPKETESGIWVIVAEDGTWHRPLTTLELAALQGLPLLHNGAPLRLSGNSEALWREHIGNGVPVQTAAAIGNAILDTLLPNIMGDWHWNYDGGCA